MKNKINEIIKTLVDATSGGQLVWNETDKSSSKRGHYRNMFAEGEDGTKFEITIEYKLTGDRWEIDQSPSMVIRNKDLPGGSYFVYGGTYDVRSVRDVVKAKYCTDMNPLIEDVVNKLDDISKGISISALRDSKLNYILKK